MRLLLVRTLKRLHFRRRYVRWNVGLVFAVVISTAWLTVPLAEDAVEDKEIAHVDLSILLGRRPYWMGHRIRYTVYERCVVEARINGISGETILIYRLGVQEPGVYTLPWDGMYHGTSPFAGQYEFELFFGEEYAAHFRFMARPIGY